MLPLTAVVCLSFLAVTTASAIKPCRGKSIENLYVDAQPQPCEKFPCRVSRGINQNITISFIPNEDVLHLTSKLTIQLMGQWLSTTPLENLDDKIFSESGEQVSFPLYAGNRYVYRVSVLVPSIIPRTRALLHWSLQDGDKDVVCFEVPVKIV